MIQTTLSVRIGDINYGGHLAHDRLVTLLHQARLKFLQHLEADEKDCFGVGLILRQLTVDYLAEAFLHDELRIDMWVSYIKPTRFTLEYRVLRPEKTIATAATIMVAFDYQKRKVCALPQDFVVAMEEHYG